MKLFDAMKRTRLILCLLVVALVAAACTQDVSSGPDEVGIVFSNDPKLGRGRVVDQPIIEPGSPVKQIDDQYVVRHVPISDRFYYITTDDQLRDPGAPRQIVCRDGDGEEVKLEVKAEFTFNQLLIPLWADRHLVRNTQIPATYFSEDRSKSVDLEVYDMGFNIRGIVTPWLQWLAEKYAAELQAVFEDEICQQFDWANMYFNYPAGANEWGLLPGQERDEVVCTTLATQVVLPTTSNDESTPDTSAASGDDPTAAENDGVTTSEPAETEATQPEPTVTANKATQHCETITTFDGEIDDSVTDEQKQSTRRRMETLASTAFTTALNLNLGTISPDSVDSEEDEVLAADSDDDGLSFFCGPGHNQNTPAKCSEIRVRIITLDVDPDLLDQRKEVLEKQEEVEANKRLDILAAQQAAIDDAARTRVEAQEIADAQSNARIDAAQATARLEEGSDELEELNILLDGQRAVKECLALDITGEECALVLSVTSKQGLPPYVGSNGDIIVDPRLSNN